VFPHAFAVGVGAGGTTDGLDECAHPGPAFVGCGVVPDTPAQFPVWTGAAGGPGTMSKTGSTCVAGGPPGIDVRAPAGTAGGSAARAWNESSASRYSAQLWKRCAGSRAIARWMIAENSGSRSGT